ncbi:GMC family oxidoreductase [Aliikangiella marina]|uniref:Cholesterol oxidase n=1 Tax=Aliikangiella marina TaxID=1712262 RepID=A0A545T8Z7_9GAMM|nr:GMC oxidoreductase [Aliikangiella marina]TQV73696.1 GMC family oxidoreductase [Aliikangiella marina]
MNNNDDQKNILGESHNDSYDIDKVATSNHQSDLKRRDFVGAMVGTIAAASMVSSTQAKGKTAEKNEEPLNIADFPLSIEEYDYEVVIVGSGFGGGVAAARASKRWPGKVLMVERGKRYGRNDFPRTFKELSNGFWRIPGDNVPRLFPLWGEQRGVFDFRSYDHMDTLVAAGYGGGSLIYGGGIIEPVSEDFDQTWPESIKRAKLKPYFELFKSCLGANQLPKTDEPERQLSRQALFETIASDAGKHRVDVDVGVFFGNDPANPTPAGTIDENRYGAEQTSCNYCGECIVGCNYQSKNSLDLNYLYVAENYFGMQVQTEHLVEKIVPLNELGEESKRADGRYGFHIYMVDLISKTAKRVKSQRVILAAGTYGSSEILFKNKKAYKTLPRVSDQLGQKYSGNGDFITLAWGSKVPTDVSRGPTIVQYIDHTSDQPIKAKQFIAEDMAIPLSILSDIVELTSPSYLVKRHLKQMLAKDDGNQDILVQVHVGLDNAAGEVSLNWFNGLRLNWPYYENMSLYEDIIEATKQAKRAIDAKQAIAFPTWTWPFRRNLTVHPLGGCVMADSSDEGVVSAALGERGRVFNYQNLFIADGSVIPSSLGANPAITIGALAEMIAEDITGIVPTKNLI